MKKVIAILLVMVCLVGALTGCTAADDVNYNLSQAADNFEVVRKITVYNARTDMIIMEMEGLMSLSNNSTSELVVTCKTGEDEYRTKRRRMETPSAFICLRMLVIVIF